MSKKIDYLFKTKPFNHQHDLFFKTRDAEFWAYFLEQGTGKTKPAIDTAAWLWMGGKIMALVVIAPNGVHDNWVDTELPEHLPDWVEHKTFVWDSLKASTKKAQAAFEEAMFSDGNYLRIFAINIDAVNTKAGSAALRRVLLGFKVLGVVDESQTIKSYKAIRTKFVLSISSHMEYRRILTGTPMPQGPLDLWPQLNFLSDTILGFSSFFAYRARYADLITETNQNNNKRYQVITGYKNLNELTGILETCSTRLTKDECLDLPPKLYQKRYVKLSDKQAKLYKELRDELITELDGNELTAPLAITKMLRLGQITGGLFPSDDEPEVPIEDNWEDLPRMQALLELTENLPKNRKAIIWCRFTAEVEAVAQLLLERHGPTLVVTYYGKTPTDERTIAKFRFQDKKDPARFFVGNPKAGGRGLTLHAATTMIYYSNDFNLETRLQSEARAHRHGQEHPVTYIDLMCKGTLDVKVVAALRKKKEVASEIMKDDPKEWI